VVLPDLQGKGRVRQRKHFAGLNFGSFFQEKERRVEFIDNNISSKQLYFKPLKAAKH